MKMPFAAMFSFFVLGATFGPSPARATEVSPGESTRSPHAFGDTGELVLTGATGLDISHATFSTPPGEPTTAPSTHLTVSPAFDVFVLRNLSVGLRANYSHEQQPGLQAYNGFSIGPHIGFNVPFAGALSLWPTVAVQYGANWQGASEGESLGIYAFAPVLRHVDSHFFVGLGPAYSRTATTVHSSASPNNSDTFAGYAIEWTMGGWVGL